MILLTEELFLPYDCGRPSGCDRIFLFGRRTHLQWLNNANAMQQLFIDGTFSTTLSLYRNGQVSYELVLTVIFFIPAARGKS